MRNNRVYMSVNAVDDREDFNLWYADGDVFLTVKADWNKENDKVAIFNRMGGELGRIKFDPNTLVYYVGVERYEYELHTYTIFEHYFFKGMLWDIHGSISDPPLDFRNEGTGKLDVRISRVRFRDKGMCYEIKVKDLSKLRIAACAVIAMKIKESWLGKSEGEPVEKTGLAKWKDRIFSNKGITYEEILAMKEAAREDLEERIEEKLRK